MAFFKESNQSTTNRFYFLKNGMIQDNLEWYKYTNFTDSSTATGSSRLCTSKGGGTESQIGIKFSTSNSDTNID